MVQAGEELLSERGYAVTMLDVIERAQAPRGSIYHHFPQGKAQLAMEVAEKVGTEIEAYVGRTATRHTDPTAFLQRLLATHRKRTVASEYALGCPLMGIVASGEAEAPLAGAVTVAFNRWTGAISAGLAGMGVRRPAAAQLATMFVTGVEGCIVLARAARSPQSFVDFDRALGALVADLTSRPGRAASASRRRRTAP